MTCCSSAAGTQISNCTSNFRRWSLPGVFLRVNFCPVFQRVTHTHPQPRVLSQPQGNTLGICGKPSLNLGEIHGNLKKTESLCVMRFSNELKLDVPWPQLPMGPCSWGHPAWWDRAGPPATTRPGAPKTQLFSTFPTRINFLLWSCKEIWQNPSASSWPGSPELCQPGAGRASRDLLLCAHSTRATGTRDTATKSL